MQTSLHHHLSAIREHFLRWSLGVPYVRPMQAGAAKFDFLIGNVEGHRWFSSTADLTYAEGMATVFFASKAKPGAVVVDVGAHHGFYTMLAATQMQASGVVVALEAERHNVEILSRNVELNGFASHVRTICAFVGDGSAGPDGNPTCRLDDILRNLTPTLLKIDVEGAENAVIDGAKAVVDLARPDILCELHPTKGADVAHIVRFLRSRSYHLSVVYEKQPMTIQLLPSDYAPLTGNDILIAQPGPC